MPADMLLALHAKRSLKSVLRFHKEFPCSPVILALTGTDVYGSPHAFSRATRALEVAAALVVLQPLAIKRIPRRFRHKARVIYQSSPRLRTVQKVQKRHFEVCVLGHLRNIKDPFRAALAARLLPESSRIRITHVGAALSPEMEKRARKEAAFNDRYRWLGALPRWRAMRVLAESHLLVLSSRLEGGANVLSEAIACGVPVLASRIPGSLGILTPTYPGFFPVGNTEALCDQLTRAECDRAFYRTLKRACAKLSPLFAPARERKSWARLLDECGAIKVS